MASRFCSEFEKLSPNQKEIVTTTPNTSISAPNNLWNTPSTIIPDDKMTFVYGPGGSKYTSAEEAEAHMVEIAVPVWRLQSDGTKTTGTAYLQVNASLSAIYNAFSRKSITATRSSRSTTSAAIRGVPASIRRAPR